MESNLIRMYGLQPFTTERNDSAQRLTLGVELELELDLVEGAKQYVRTESVTGRIHWLRNSTREKLVKRKIELEHVLR